MDARRLIDIGSKTVQFCSFGRFPFHEGKARARPSPVSGVSLAPLFILPALPLFDLSLLLLVSLLISKDVDFVELPRIPRGFLKRRHYCGCSQYTMFRQEDRKRERERDRFFHAQTLLIFNPGRSFIRERSLVHRQHTGISFACR